MKDIKQTNFVLFACLLTNSLIHAYDNFNNIQISKTTNNTIDHSEIPIPNTEVYEDGSNWSIQLSQISNILIFEAPIY